MESNSWTRTRIVLLQLRCASKNMALATMHAVHCDWSENEVYLRVYA